MRPETQHEAPQRFPAHHRSHPGHSHPYPVTSPRRTRLTPGRSQSVGQPEEAELVHDDREPRNRRSLNRHSARRPREKARGSRKVDSREGSTSNQTPQSPPFSHMHAMAAYHSPTVPHLPLPPMKPYYNPNRAASPGPYIHQRLPPTRLNAYDHYPSPSSPTYLTTTYTIFQPMPTSPTFIPPDSLLFSPAPRHIVQSILTNPSFIVSPTPRLYSPTPHPIAGIIPGPASFMQPSPESQSHHSMYHHSRNLSTPSRDIHYDPHYNDPHPSPHISNTTTGIAYNQTAHTQDYYTSSNVSLHADPRSGWPHEGHPDEMTMSNLERDFDPERTPPSLEHRSKREAEHRASYATERETVSQRPWRE